VRDRPARDILPADVSSNLAAPGTTPQQILKAVETATSEEVAKTRKAQVGAIDGLLASYGQREGRGRGGGGGAAGEG
jgi:hypothetical protein